MAAGIDDVAIYIPRLYLDAADFANARGLDPVKLQKGLGVSQMAIVDANQDPACLAANACLRIMEKNNLSPDDIGRLYISTESAFDESKAMNSYVIGMLEQVYGQGSFEHCGGVETKFACVSGSYALYDNTNWIRAGESEGKSALVVVSDIAKYDMGSSGEMTQGAGSVVMLLNDKPRLLEFDPKVTSTSIKDEYDFYRPFGKETPIVHGQYSSLIDVDVTFGSNSNNLGVSLSNITTEPAPCVISPLEPISYFAISETTTNALFPSDSPALIQFVLSYKA